MIRISPLVIGSIPHSTRASDAAAAAEQAGDAHHLAAMHDEVDIAGLRGARDAAQLDQRLAQRAVPRSMS